MKKLAICFAAFCGIVGFAADNCAPTTGYCLDPMVVSRESVSEKCVTPQTQQIVVDAMVVQPTITLECPVMVTKDVVINTPVMVDKNIVIDKPVLCDEQIVVNMPNVCDRQIVIEKPVFVDRQVVVEKKVFVDKEIVVERPVFVEKQVVIDVPRVVERPVHFEPACQPCLTRDSAVISNRSQMDSVRYNNNRSYQNNRRGRFY